MTLTLDENSRDALIALIGVLGGLLTGVTVAAFGFRHARATDRERWQREDALRRDELEHDRRDRWIDRRREVCVVVASTAMTLQQMAVNHRAGRRVNVDAYGSLLERGFAATAELRLISEDLATTGGDLMIAASEVLMTATTERRTSLEAGTAAFQDALADFMAAAQANLQR